jgi:hypothetical protein
MMRRKVPGRPYQRASSARNREAIHRTRAMVVSHSVTMFTRPAAQSTGEFIDETIRRWRAGCTLDSISRSVCKLVRDAIGAAGRSAQPGGAHGLSAEFEERRERERAVGHCVDQLRVGGAQVFHDVRGGGRRLDHVIISRRGVFVVETRALAKPWPKAKVYVEGRKLLVAGKYLEHDPRAGAAAAARWIEAFLKKSTGKRFTARAIVAFPGWYVQQNDPPGSVWVIEPKALPALLDHEAPTVPTADVALAAWHLSRYVRMDHARAA